jgi:hypothetical protein
MRFRKFTETNDAEGETWHHWLQCKGNKDELKRLETYLHEADPHGDEFKLEDHWLDEHEVDLLVEHGDNGYMKQHTKVLGKLTLPSDFESFFPDEHFYKGDIVRYFERPTE